MSRAWLVAGLLLLGATIDVGAQRVGRALALEDYYHVQAVANPQISPDGRWIAYASDEAGSIAVYVARFPDLGQKTLVAKGGRQGIFWGSDSRQLIYIGDGPSLVDLNLGAEVRVVSRRQLLFGRNPGPEGSNDIFVSVRTR